MYLGQRFFFLKSIRPVSLRLWRRGDRDEESIGRGGNGLILSDSQAAIAAVKKAGQTGKARTRDLRRIIQQIQRRQDNLGPGAVRFGWVKLHIGIVGNEKADEQAKLGTEDLYPNPPYITEGGLKQEWKIRREAERRVRGTGMGRVVRWNRKARVNYVHCRTGKRNLQVWRHKLDTTINPTCRRCRRFPKTGTYKALTCIHQEEIGSKWGSYEDMDDKGKWANRVKEVEKTLVTDLVEAFFTKLGMRWFTNFICKNLYPLGKGRDRVMAAEIFYIY